MQVILLERVEKLGQMGDVVTVKDGYARNFLLPQNKALRASKDNVARFEADRGQLEATNLAQRQEAEGLVSRFDGLSLVILRQASEAGQLYGSVSARDVVTGLAELGVTIERRQVLLDATIKSLGLTPVRIALHPEVTVEVAVNVARSAAEAEAQASAGEAEEAGLEAYFEDEELASRAEAEAQTVAPEDEAEPAPAEAPAAAESAEAEASAGEVEPAGDAGEDEADKKD